MPHYLKADYRIASLTQIVNGLSASITYLKQKTKEEDWYDGGWFLEETEPIIGLAFIAFQNYINSSIKDLPDKILSKVDYYKINSKVMGYDKSGIELIIGLANYFKHRDDEVDFHNHTKQILECFELKYKDRMFIEESPIFEGLYILNENWNLFEILEIVRNWRESLWE